MARLGEGAAAQGRPWLIGIRIRPQNRGGGSRCKNVTLTDPISYRDSGSGMGHLQYRIDNGPYILPMANRLVFEGLTPGKHTIDVSLADGSFRSMGADVELELVIP